MKKTYIALAAAMLALVSCDPELNKEDQPEKNPQPEAVTYEFTYNVGDKNTQTLEFCDLSITYSDAEGKKQTEKVTELPWVKTIGNLKAGFQMELTKKITPKKDVDLNKFEGKSVTLSNLNVGYNVTGTDGFGTGSFVSGSLTIAKERGTEFIQRLIEKNKPFTYTHKAQ